MSIVNEHKMKLILLGNGKVGKTSIATRYTKNKFIPKYKPSLGVDFLVKRITLGSKILKIMVFDTGGQEFISALRKRYYYGAVGAIVVYSIDSEDSFKSLKKWLDELNKEVKGILTIIVGNKNDLEESRVVSRERAEKFAADQNALYFEASALTGDNIEGIFQVFIDKVAKENNL